MIKINLTGQRFGRLVVVEEIPERIKEKVFWKCLCDCGNYKNVQTGNLRNGKTNSCGCLKIEEGKNKRKYNTFEILEEYVIGYTSKNEEFYFDKIDLDRIKDNYWYISPSDNRVYCTDRVFGYNKRISLHRFIMNFPKEIVDHENRNPRDNRRMNLRIATFSQNSKNHRVSIKNTSGIIGVSYCARDRLWASIIMIDKKTKNLGHYKDFCDAVYARLKGEKEYYKEFAPQKHLFEQYGL